MGDSRLVWLKKLVSTSLFVRDVDYEDGLHQGRDYVTDFLNESPVGTALIFYTGSVNEEKSKTSESPEKEKHNSESENEGDAKEGDEGLNDSMALDQDAFANTLERKKLVITITTIPDLDDDASVFYLIKRVDGEIPEDNEMDLYLDYGVLPGHSLIMLERLLTDVYIPMSDPSVFSANKEFDDLDEVDKESSTSNKREQELDTDMLQKNEFNISIQKFSSQISHAIQQVCYYIFITL